MSVFGLPRCHKHSHVTRSIGVGRVVYTDKDASSMPDELLSLGTRINTFNSRIRPARTELGICADCCMVKSLIEHLGFDVQLPIQGSITLSTLLA